jgi:hypothetical protein
MQCHILNGYGVVKRRDGKQPGQTRVIQWAEETQKEHVARTKTGVLWNSETKYTVLSLVLGIGQQGDVQVQEVASE